MKEDFFNEIAAATKDTGLTLNGCKVYSNPYIEEGIIYLYNENEIHMNYPLRKDGRYDMRYGINKMKALLKI